MGGIIEGHIIRLLADGEMPYRALRQIIERDLGAGKVATCRAVKGLTRTGQIERIVPDEHKQFQILRLGKASHTTGGKRAALIELAAGRGAEEPSAIKIGSSTWALARRTRDERKRPALVRAVPVDPLGRWWLDQ